MQGDSEKAAPGWGQIVKSVRLANYVPMIFTNQKNYAPPAKQFEYDIQLAGIQREMYNFLLMTVCHQQKK